MLVSCLFSNKTKSAFFLFYLCGEVFLDSQEVLFVIIFSIVIYFVPVHSSLTACSCTHELHWLPNGEPALSTEEAVCLKSDLCMTRVKKGSRSEGNK